ncbi:DNA mismatch repair protein MutS [Bacillus taeanensis]|uniref:DNA mismatch repair protein MutS n=1 Tax=Bacillus taeanensis TaxID=273032 RepID=A0A366XXQ2_9BACI|nr:DNA mismatch repair protein MutS [Bacillus taeanensis]RBW69925.1 DNA mismatch repair protein MutS [Bacillus taeanensis]
MAKYTPMIQQYLQIKAQYEDAFLFFRLGDFYEMFFEDAKRASQELEITLTSRDGGGQERIPMCGVPYHSAENYIQQLLAKGYKIAICEQTEDPKQAKGVVKREVVQLITPGTVMNGSLIEEKENNYIASISDFKDGSFGFALCDLTTGEGRVTLLTGEWQDVLQEFAAAQAKECILEPGLDDTYKKDLTERFQVTLSYEENSTMTDGLKPLVEKLEQEKLTITFGRLINYLLRTQQRSLEHLQAAEYYQPEAFMKLDIHSKRNLELVETIRTKGRNGSLLWLLDKTVTAMGGRLLKHWIERPLLDCEVITVRHHVVETFIEQFFEREEIRELLKGVYDLERLAGKVAFGNVNGRDLIQLKKSLQQLPIIIETVKKLNNPYCTRLAEAIDPCEPLAALLERGLKEEAPLSVKEGNMIRDGFNEQLDQYRDASRNGKTWIAQLELQEKQSTGIKSLKIGYNKVFGYYIEVTKANLHLLPEGRYERKQTLTNAERYITPELKEKETLILEAEEKIVDLEYELFMQIREEVKTYIQSLQEIAKKVSELDVLQSFATISEEQQYVKPQFSKREIQIISGRHAVVEKVMDRQLYVANDVYMNEERELLLITGPNMSGKSTYMRQLALTAIMAQIGCFVPAEEAVLPVFDQVFTRIGAADDLVGGQSTFMVEMLETKHALSKATQNSLILLDEIGRGTSTYDGMALAQAIIEYIHEKIGCKTLFSTHYHELTALEKELNQLKNVHVKAVEENGQVVFLHKVHDGAADKSYGIHVAKLADLPDQLIDRAQEILIQFENGKQELSPVPHIQTEESNRKEDTIEKDASQTAEEPAQLSLFEAEDKSVKKKYSSQEEQLRKALLDINLLDMTPLDAMNTLYELQKKVKK